MRILRSLAELKRPPARLALTIGNFDGVHRAHQRLLARVVRTARARGGTAAALTFEPHPTKVLGRNHAPPLLTTLEQKLRRLEAAGLDLVIVLPFTRALSRLSPRAFVEKIVCGRLRAEALYVGTNFRFGHRAAGHAPLLRRLGRELGFTVHVIPRVRVSGRPASSSLIRRLISSGHMERAARFLGRPFALTGSIRPGAGRGRPLGFPTLNFVPEQECLPARGVYATETLVGGRTFPSATNIGTRPTFGGARLLVESHLLGFSRRLRRGRIEVRFRARLRGEKKFPSPEALRAQIRRDVARVRRYCARRRAS